MKRLFILFYSAVCVLLLPLAGCALPTVQESLDQFIGTKFTNPSRPEKRWVQVKDKDGREMTIIHPSYYSIVGNQYQWAALNDEPLYYKKELEEPNTRYYISAWANLYTDCRYSLLVSPEDIILTWRNEGP
jgi:hypothetical protein